MSTSAVNFSEGSRSGPSWIWACWNFVDTKGLTHDVVRIGNRSAARSALFLQSYGWLHGDSFPLV